MILPIHIYGDKVLRANASPVASVTEELSRLADDMLETMYDSHGVGLAAPQVGRSERLIVVDVSGEDDEASPYVIFNPQVEEGEGEEVAEEGCLSIPGVWAQVKRESTITVTGLDREGRPLRLENIDGLLARCILHEIDHLNGVLFVDRISATEKALNSGKLKKLAKESKARTT